MNFAECGVPVARSKSPAVKRTPESPSLLDPHSKVVRMALALVNLISDSFRSLQVVENWRKRV